MSSQPILPMKGFTYGRACKTFHTQSAMLRGVILPRTEGIHHEAQLLIKFVADMDHAVEFYRDVLGLQLKFEFSRLERVCHRRN